MSRWYDPISETWHTMPAAPVVERSKRQTVAEEQLAKANQHIRIAEYAHVWDAIEATATATQMSAPCPAGSDKAESES